MDARLGERQRRRKRRKRKESRIKGIEKRVYADMRGEVGGGKWGMGKWETG